MRLAESSLDGLPRQEAAARLEQYGPNAIHPNRQLTALRLLLKQFESPFVVILVFAAIVSAAVHEWVDAAIVLLIVFASALLSYFQEYSAGKAVEKLRVQVRVTSDVLRDGAVCTIPSDAIVPGDVVLLSAGCLVPADGIVLTSNDFFVNQAVLMGETFPVEKTSGAVAETAGLAGRTNVVYMGTNVRSGSASMLVIHTGAGTEFGQIADKLAGRPAETEFERGTRHFGYMITQMMMALVTVIFIVNTLLQKPFIDSLLFAIALAVGLAPELLPAIISISLSKGAQNLAKAGVIVRRLNAIENLGSMNVLCTDKTGTITQGVVRLDDAMGVDGLKSADVLRWAWLNASFQTGIKNPLDEAILAAAKPTLEGVAKVGEIPYDFHRKRLSIVVQDGAGADARQTLITKGALKQVMDVCTLAHLNGQDAPLDADTRAGVLALFSAWSEQGYRVLGVAVKEVPFKPAYTVSDDERDMTLAGFLLFFDPPKADATETLDALKGLGVSVKIITGDNQLVARHVAQMIGLPADSVLPAEQIAGLSSEAFAQVAENTAIFAEVDPNQKEQIILALRKRGNVVGYMGDGINDAPALHAADIGISVDSAVDVAKEAADFVLLKQDLRVLLKGITEGRRTFANTLKYIYITISANFGNMVSMGGASLFLPFLPLLAKQILLNNFLSDFPGTGLPGDNVDPEMLAQPRRWNIKSIRSFMVVFGLVSSLFDYATFGLLLFVARTAEAQFQTGWFVESLLSELCVALVVRTRRQFYRSRPGRVLLVITLSVAIFTLAVPYLPFAPLLGLTPLPLWLMLSLLGVTLLYVFTTEWVKAWYFKRFP